jgi:hypothetical protein
MERSHSWPSALAWKASIPQGIAGSNPALSAKDEIRVPEFGDSYLVLGEVVTDYELFLPGQDYRAVGRGIRRPTHRHLAAGDHSV